MIGDNKLRRLQYNTPVCWLVFYGRELGELRHQDNRHLLQ